MRKGCSENKGKPLSRVRGLRGRRAPSCSALGDTSHQGGRASPALTGLRCARCLCGRSSGGCWELSRVRRHPGAPATRLPGAGPTLPLGQRGPARVLGRRAPAPPVSSRLCRLLAQGCICSCPHSPLSRIPGRKASCCPAGRSALLLLRGTRVRNPTASEPRVPCEQEE